MCVKVMTGSDPSQNNLARATAAEPKQLQPQVQPGREPRQPGKQREKNGVTCIPKQAAGAAPAVAVLVIATIFPPFSVFSQKGGCYPPFPSPKAEKQTTVALASAGAELGVNTGCCDVCVVSE